MPSLPEQPATVLVLDVDGNGRDDVVAALESAGDIAVLLDDGLGALQEPTNVPVGNEPVRVVPADFGGGGLRDLVVVHDASASVTALISTDDTPAYTPTTLDTVSFPDSAVVADLDGDGLLDVAAQDGLNINIFPGAAGGGFLEREIITDIGRPHSLATADIDGRLGPDLILGDGFTDSTSIRVLLNDGAGGFEEFSSTPTIVEPIHLLVSDVDLDGIPDVIAGSEDRSIRSFALHLGGTTGALGSLRRYDIGSLGGGIAVADLDGDGDPDVVSYSARRVIHVLLNGRR